METTLLMSVMDVS